MSSAAIFHDNREGGANQAFGLSRFFRISAKDTGGSFSLWEEHIPEGVGPPLHIHKTEIELFVVLEGTVRFRCDDAERDIGPGASVMIPAGHPHTFKGIGPGLSRVLVMLTPGDGMQMFHDVEAEGLVPPDDMDRIVEIAASYGVEFVGPPLD